MILVRIEPIETTVFPAGISDKKDFFLSQMPKKMKPRMARKFDDDDLGNVIGCWFSPAYSKTSDIFDAIDYANNIIGIDHPESDLRIIAIHIHDHDIDRFQVSHKPLNSFAQLRSRNPRNEFLIPTEIIQAKAKIIMTISKGHFLEDHEYRTSLINFEQTLPHSSSIDCVSKQPKLPQKAL